MFLCGKNVVKNAVGLVVSLLTIPMMNILLPLSSVQALPAGFEDESVIQMTGAVDVTFVGNMMLAITDKGVFYTVDLEESEASSNVALDLRDRICENGERGLVGITVHPNFDENRWVYLFYTYNNGFPDCPVNVENGPVNRCSRFVLKDDWTADNDSELVLFTQYGQIDKLHNGGDMEFGVDGMLYVTAGDAGGRRDGWAQARWNLHGNIIRITDSGGIPQDNPFLGAGTARCNENGRTDEDKICQEIYAFGLRNPFRFTMDPHSTDKVRYLISDVGSKSWEEVNVGGADHAGANYGWPNREGPCQYNKVDEECYLSGEDAEVTDPYYWYQHNAQEEGAAVGIAIPPEGSGWPEQYNDPESFYFADFVYGKIYHVTKNANRGCDTCNPPRPPFRNETFHEFPNPVFLKFGPNPNYLTAGSSPMALYYNHRCCNQFIRRIVYRGGDNFAPVAAFDADPSNVLVGGRIRFDASDTTDADHLNEDLTFSWDFGDGSSEQIGMQVTHRFDEVGVYEVQLTVTDPLGGVGSHSEWISVGAPPTVEMINPPEGATFAVGDVFTLIGSGMDHDGNILDVNTQLTWEVRQRHASHFHPFLTEGTMGNEISILPAPSPEDFYAATTSFLQVLLTGTDSNGISTTISRDLMPRTVNIDFDTIPSGLTLVIDGEELIMPQSVVSWENHNIFVTIPEQDGYWFLSGPECAIVTEADQNGGGGGESFQTLMIVVPPTPEGDVLSYIFTFQEVATIDPPVEITSMSPTKSPTTSPSATTTKSQTNDPTPDQTPGATSSMSPTDFPTISPSASTTKSQTNGPTSGQTPDATSSMSPTDFPTISPSASTTKSETNGPTSGHISGATSSPTIVHSMDPTRTPQATSGGDVTISSPAPQMNVEFTHNPTKGGEGKENNDDGSNSMENDSNDNNILEGGENSSATILKKDTFLFYRIMVIVTVGAAVDVGNYIFY